MVMVMDNPGSEFGTSRGGILILILTRLCCDSSSGGEGSVMGWDGSKEILTRDAFFLRTWANYLTVVFLPCLAFSPLLFSSFYLVSFLSWSLYLCDLHSQLHLYRDLTSGPSATFHRMAKELMSYKVHVR